MTNIGVEVSERDSVPVVAVNGEIDRWTAPRLREELVTLIGDGVSRVVVDLDQVDFLDSTALGVMVGAHKRLVAAGGGLLLVCSKPRILRVLEVTGLDRVLALHDSVGAAVAAAS